MRSHLLWCSPMLLERGPSRTRSVARRCLTQPASQRYPAQANHHHRALSAVACFPNSRQVSPFAGTHPAACGLCQVPPTCATRVRCRYLSLQGLQRFRHPQTTLPRWRARHHRHPSSRRGRHLRRWLLWPLPLPRQLLRLVPVPLSPCPPHLRTQVRENGPFFLLARRSPFLPIHPPSPVQSLRLSLPCCLLRQKACLFVRAVPHLWRIVSRPLPLLQRHHLHKSSCNQNKSEAGSCLASRRTAGLSFSRTSSLQRTTRPTASQRSPWMRQ